MSPTASDTSASAGLSVRGLAVTYGDLRAVNGVDLEVAAGEVVALLGASGSGKSSLLRAVAGLEDVAAGEVAWDGRSMVRVPVHKRGFGLMFQDGQLFEHRDVGSNIAYGLTGLPRAERSERVREMLELVGLPGFERRRVTTLSGGQAQRVALARALAPAPRLLLLDEPLSALDRALREQLATDVRTILRRGGTTALYVTHDQDEAMTVADRVGVMEAGRLLRLDTPQRLWADPASRKVARFLGFDVVGDLALAPGALRVVEAAAGKPGEPDGPAQTEIPATPGTPGTLPATVLASRLRRGQWEAEVELDPERLAGLAGTAGLAGPDEVAGLDGPAEPSGVEADAAADREPVRAARATALTRRPHAPGTRVTLYLDPARTARL
ncbi:ABC transporter ATP-binding protein [Actinomyces oris]|uniref:ABC transporter ATP-binding protein n=1 Tax=Actinomyces oris TaxID=544580 RepID=UPI000C770B22|nr:ABC transporter ATP-binding protein [Actinomyces oris]PKY74477.1 ABC transporter ATP-binding protein [Actinomyces oris]